MSIMSNTAIPPHGYTILASEAKWTNFSMKKPEPRIKGCHSGLGNGFLDMIPAQQAKEKMD